MLFSASRPIVLATVRGRLGSRLLHASLPQAKIRPLRMPTTRLYGEDARVGAWALREGDHFAAGDLLVKIETDEYYHAHEAKEDGVLAKIIHPTGAAVTQGAVIALLADRGDDITHFDPSAFSIPASEQRLEALTRPTADIPRGAGQMLYLQPEHKTFNSFKSVTELTFEPGFSDKSQGVLGPWFIKENEPFRAGDTLVKIEVGKHSYAIFAKKDGVLLKTTRQQGEPVSMGTVLALLSHDHPVMPPPSASDEYGYAIPYNAFLS